MLKKVKITIYYNDKLKSHLGRYISRYIDNTLLNDFHLIAHSINEEEVDIIEL